MNPRRAVLECLQRLQSPAEPTAAAPHTMATGVLFEAALWIAAEHDSELKPAEILAQLPNLQHEVSSGLADLPANEMAQALLRRLTALGFQQDELGPLRPHAALLHRVLQRRRGQPLCLALIALELARRLGIALQGINFPGHFLLRAPGADHLLDPCGGRRLYTQDCRELLTRQFGANVQLQAGYMSTAEPALLLQRLSRNLRHLHLQNDNHLAALKDAERALELGPPAVGDYVARAEIYRHLECPQAERYDLQRALLLTEDRLQSLRLTQRLQQLQGHNPNNAKNLH